MIRITLDNRTWTLPSDPELVYYDRPALQVLEKILIVVQGRIEEIKEKRRKTIK